MRTIGFTEKYYTLWIVSKPITKKEYYNGMEIGYTTFQNVTYMQNLSMDFDAAKAKMGNNEYEIDLGLRGHSSFKRIVKSEIKDRENFFPQDCFSFGMLEGSKFSEATDVWQLKRAYNQEKSARRRVCARRRLLELGELFKYQWEEKQSYNANWGKTDEMGRALPQDIQDKIVVHNYATATKKSQLESIKKSTHYFIDGEKVELELKEINKFGYDTQFGWVSIAVYETKCGKIVKYKGGSCPDISREVFVKVKATVKNTVYNEVKETMLQRIKILEKVSE